MQFHPVAEIFPLMSPTEFESLVDDIRANTLREAIWIHDGQIIDGRNRYNACTQLGIEPRYREWDGAGSLVSFVVSLNLTRRHLNESQRAMVAQRLSTFRFGDNQHTASEGPQICEPLSQTDAAKLLNVSPRTVSSAKKVADKGAPELIQKVESGEISVSAAAELADLPKFEQKREIKKKRLIRKGREASRKIMASLQVTALKQATKGGRVCVVCSPTTQDTVQNFLAAIQILGKRFPSRKQYLTDIIEEMGQEELRDETVADRDRVMNAIRLGYSEHNDCRTATGISHDRFDLIIADLLDYKNIIVVPQGGKHEEARGARKKIYEIIEQVMPDVEIDDDLDYEPVDDGW